jgi:hypothetical protein
MAGIPVRQTGQTKIKNKLSPMKCGHNIDRKAVRRFMFRIAFHDSFSALFFKEGGGHSPSGD